MLSGRRNNLDRLNDPAASMLDLDDDRRSSMASSDYYGDDIRQSIRNDDGDGDDEPLPRMSLLGPKMRFHSRAPWEMDENTLQEEDEEDFDSFLSTAKRSFGPPSPRQSIDQRPSGESTRSQLNSQKSFETAPSHGSYNMGSLYPMPQEDSPASSDRQPFRGKVYLSRIPSDSNPSSPSSTSRFGSEAHSPSHRRFPDMSASPEHESNFSSPHLPAASPRRPSFPDEVHPYANPDLVSQVYDQHHLSDERTILRTGDSLATLTDSSAPSNLSKSNARLTRVPETLMSVIPKSKTSTLHGKEISSPISVHNPGLRPSHDSEDIQSLSSQRSVMGFPCRTDLGVPPAFGLISLEEARAQRSRSITADSAASRPSTSTFVSSSAVLFPDAGHEQSNLTIDQREYGHDVGARGRSISAGSKSKNAKNAFHTIIGGQPKSDRQAHESGVSGNNASLPGKTLKHKKSGFMRLFNGARQEKEEKSQPPPVPSLSDAFANFNMQQHEQKVSKSMRHRVPVPELSGPATTGRTVPQYDEHPPPSEDVVYSRPSPSPKRPLPSLSIDTLTQSPSSCDTFSSVEDLSFQSRATPGSSGLFQNRSAPQTAPAHVSEFPALKLRPISTMFSAHFGDHIIKDARPSLDTDLGTPDSSTNILSPLTPNSSARCELSGSEKPTSDEQASSIYALKEKHLSAKMSWQRQIWELEGQVRDLKVKLEGLRASSGDGEYCHTCGRGKQQDGLAGRRPSGNIQEVKTSSVVHRPRARTGTSSRFASGLS